MVNTHLGICSVLLLFFTNILWAQQGNYWTRSGEISNITTEVNKALPSKQKVFDLELSILKEALKKAPTNQSIDQEQGLKLIFPDASGEMVSYKVKEAPVMHPDLAKKYPDNKSYVGVSEKDGTKKIRFSINELGFYAVIRDLEGGAQYIEPRDKEKKSYGIFFKSNLKNRYNFECLTESTPVKYKASAVKITDDGLLRTYRLALAATAEYSEYHIKDQNVENGTDEEKKAVVLSAMTTAMTIVNEIYENDLAVTMQLVANNDELIFLDPVDDPYSNLDESAMLGQNQSTCDDVIGSDNYDIGHVFGTGGGGVSSLSVVCQGGSKARGVTGLPDPIGNYFYFDYVAHEMGHQFGANHTFNGDENLCQGDNRNDETAVEPGSGSSLMSYAGLCDPQNVQGSVDPYFHIVSIAEIRTFITAGSGSTCALESNLILNQNAPEADAGDDFVIPAGTPFKLTGQGSDADNDPLSFSWEQIDNEITVVPPSSSAAGGALYRSLPPTQVPVRYLPNLSTLLNGEISSIWEVTPEVGREINFAFTVRDNNAAGGQVSSDELLVTVIEEAGPFTVTSQSTEDLVWTPGDEETVTWDVAGTDGNGINASQVNILMSTDYGKTFSVVLASNVPNDGSQTITVPEIESPQCYIMVEAVGNIFFGLNSKSFSIGEFNQICAIHEANDTPVAIPDNDENGIASTVNVPDDVNVEQVKVRLINTDNATVITPGITHTYLGDLTITLESPEGTIVNLIDRACDNSEDIQVILDDNGDPVNNCSSLSPGLSGVIQPADFLSVFNGENAMGNWILKVVDHEDQDEGFIQSWGLEICSSEPVLGVNNYVFEDFTVYPNPSNGVFRIKFRSEDAGDVGIEVYDLLGRRILQKTYNNRSNDFEEEMDLKQVSGGIYILRVERGNKMSSHKIRIK